MLTPKQITARFHAMLKEKESAYGRGFNKDLSLKTGLSTGYLSEILAGDKPGSQKAQMDICEAVGVDYSKLIKGEVVPRENINQLYPPHMADVISKLIEIDRHAPEKITVIQHLIFLCYDEIVKKRGQGTGTA